MYFSCSNLPPNYYIFLHILYDYVSPKCIFPAATCLPPFPPHFPYIPTIFIYPRHPPKIYFKKHLSCSSLPPTIPPGLTSPFSTSHSEIECKLFKCLMLKIQIQTSMGMWRYLGIRLCPIVIIPPSYSV